MAQFSDPWLRAASVLLLFAAWAAGAQIVDDPVLPGPAAVGAQILAHAGTGELSYHVGVTLARVAVAFTIAMALGAAAGLVMGRNRPANALFDVPLIVGLNIPALVIIVLCYVWFGLTEVAAILAVAVNKIPIVVVTMREGARAIDADLLQVAQSFRLSRRRTLFRIYLPQLYPYLMASARSGLSLIWKIVLVVELLGRSDGVGFKLAEFFQFFDIAGILAYSLVFVAIVMVIELLAFVPLERRVAAWRT
jgi:NitT/TauT family transport system permease protein